MVELRIESIANGGAGVARAEDGRVVFVRGGLPGEVVEAEILDEKGRYAEAIVEAVVAPSAHRVEPPCPHVGAGCGGCDFQHADPAWQPDAKAQMVFDALERIGQMTDPDVVIEPPLPAHGYRTSVRCVLVDGRAGYRRRRSHDAVAVDSCLVAHPLIEELITEGRFTGVKEVTLRASVFSGQRLAVCHPGRGDTVLPEDVIVVGRDELRRKRRAHITERVADRQWRISALSFFQARPDGAEALVGAVRGAVGEAPERLADLYAGVGLFAGSLGAARSYVVESSGSAAADARRNLADIDATVVRCRVEDWRPSAVDVVVADPSRSGLGRAAVGRIAATRASQVVLVSCDAGALGRDAGLLGAAGYRLDTAAVVDLFPQTSHVEVVSSFSRA